MSKWRRGEEIVIKPPQLVALTLNGLPDEHFKLTSVPSAMHPSPGEAMVVTVLASQSQASQDRATLAFRYDGKAKNFEPTIECSDGTKKPPPPPPPPPPRRPPHLPRPPPPARSPPPAVSPPPPRRHQPPPPPPHAPPNRKAHGVASSQLPTASTFAVIEKKQPALTGQSAVSHAPTIIAPARSSSRDGSMKGAHSGSPPSLPFLAACTLVAMCICVVVSWYRQQQQYAFAGGRPERLRQTPDDGDEFSSDEDDFAPTRSKAATLPADAVAGTIKTVQTVPAPEPQEPSIIVEEARTPVLVALSAEGAYAEKHVVPKEEEEHVPETSSWFQQRMIEAGGIAMNTENPEEEFVVPEMRSMRLPKNRGEMLPLD